jgi:hypothetical protein
MSMPYCYLKSFLLLLLLVLTGCQGELYNNAELFEEKFGEASTTNECETDSATGFSQGDGSVSAPFEICNKEQLINLAIKLNNVSSYLTVASKHFKLTANIDMNGPEEVTYPMGFLAVNILADKAAPNLYPFKGVFDGDNYYVDNIVMNLDDQNYVGFFQHLGPTAVVKNLRLRGMISVSDTSYYVGSVAGYSEGKIENVISYITLNLDTTTYAGGLVGYQKNNEIIDSEYRGFVKVDDSGTHVGGILGGAKSVELNDVLNFSDVQGKDYVGGIVGSAETITADLVSSYKVVSGSGHYVGGIAGRLFSNSSLTNLIARSRVITTGNYAGALVGVSENSNISIAASSCLVAISNVDCQIQAGNYAGGIAGACLGNNSFDQITINRSLISDGYGAALGCAYNEGVNISNSTLDGIVKASNHYIAGAVAYSTGPIELSQVEVNADIFGSAVNSQNYLGMVTGYTSGQVVVTSSEFNGTIGEDPNDPGGKKCHDYVGGLIGENTKTVEVSDTEINLTVNCTGNFIGGIFGANSAESGSSAQISSSTFSGSVSGFYAVGGVVGISQGEFNLNSTTISGDVIAESYYAGGVAGMVDANSNNFSVNRADFNGTVEAPITAGGIIAYGSGAISINDSYIGFNGGIRLTSEAKSGGVAGDITSAFISDVHVYRLDMPTTSSESMGGLIGIGTELQIIRSSIKDSDITGNTMLGGIAASLSSSFLEMIQVSEVNVVGAGDYIAGGVAILNGSTLSNLQLGSSDANKAPSHDFVSGGNYVTGGIARIESASMIRNSISTFDISVAGARGGFVAIDLNADSVTNQVYFDSDRAGTPLIANGLGVNYTRIEMTDIIMFGSFDFNSWSQPTVSTLYPELQL